MRAHPGAVRERDLHDQQVARRTEPGAGPGLGHAARFEDVGGAERGEPADDVIAQRCVADRDQRREPRGTDACRHAPLLDECAHPSSRNQKCPCPGSHRRAAGAPEAPRTGAQRVRREPDRWGRLATTPDTRGGSPQTVASRSPQASRCGPSPGVGGRPRGPDLQLGGGAAARTWRRTAPRPRASRFRWRRCTSRVGVQGLHQPGPARRTGPSGRWRARARGWPGRT